MQRKRPLYFLLAILLYTGSALVSGCSKPQPDSTPPKDTLAVVNDVPITQADVDYLLHKGPKKDPTAAEKRAVLETLIRQELIRQKALEEGLDEKPEVADKLRKLRAQYMALQRDELGERYYRHEVVEQAEVSEKEVRQYFEEHKDRLLDEYHVLRIIYRDEAEALEDVKALEAGTPFEELAEERNPAPAELKKRPWDMGFLKSTHIPDSWRAELAQIEPGETTGLLEGKGDRFWLLKLKAKRKNEGGFESVKGPIEEMLQRERIEQLRIEKMQALREEADIEYLD